jgi:hypothetical protein
MYGYFLLLATSAAVPGAGYSAVFCKTTEIDSQIMRPTEVNANELLG